MSQTTKKLYRVTTHMGAPGYLQTHYDEFYVVATDPTTAYQQVRAFLDAHDLGVWNRRELQSVELLAEAVRYPNCKMILMGVEEKKSEP